MNRPAVGNQARRGAAGGVAESGHGVRRRQTKNVRPPSDFVPRQQVSDAQWRGVQPYLMSRAGDKGRKPKNLRRTFEGILWIFRTGAPWRDLPGYFGKWNSVYKAFKRMCDRGAFMLMFMSLAKELDFKIVMVDGSFVKVHQRAAVNVTVTSRALRRRLGRRKAV